MYQNGRSYMATMSQNFYDYLKTFLDAQRYYEDNYCQCIEQGGKGAWCRKWFYSDTVSYCTLGGESEAKYCPMARQYENTDVALYYTTHPIVCSKAERKYFQY